MKIIHYQRRPYKSQVSIERLFDQIRSFLSNKHTVVVSISPFLSKDLVPRLKNMLHAGRQQGDVHHVVGDAHYLVFALPRAKTVLTIHDCAALNRLTGWKRQLLRYFWFVGPIKRASMVTTISKTTKNELKKWVGSLADKIQVIPNCVGAEFTPYDKPFNKKNPVVLQVGTGWNKNVGRVAAALKGTSCRLEIVGNLSKSQRETVTGTGVPFSELGRVSDEELLKAYQRCDVLIFASQYEGFGLPILEAQAIGRPVITSNCSSMPEAAGEGALFVDPESIESIHNAVNELLGSEHLRNSLVEKGFQNVNLYRAEVIAKRYSEVYEQMIPKD